ncbi:MAG: prepilin-type N-terminal cleavage/methylation domain-containing protein [Lysobacterales bacterium]|jgi:prepilin-type N-terminal cleavage/methylation domain-containing protein
MKLIRNIRAFTLVEIMVVIIIVGVITGLVASELTKSLEKQKLRNTELNVTAILAKIQVAFAQGKITNNTSVQLSDTSEVNAFFNMDINDSNFTYLINHCGGGTMLIVATSISDNLHYVSNGGIISQGTGIQYLSCNFNP